MHLEGANSPLAALLGACLAAVAHSLIAQRATLNQLDSDCGDGDCGDSLAALAQQILRHLGQGLFGSCAHPHQVFRHLSELLENGGGSLCILLALFFSAAARAFVQRYVEKLSSLVVITCITLRDTRDMRV